MLILCTHWEPVMGDGWSHYGWHRTTSIGLGSLYEFGEGIYFYENPRFGQIVTLLSYARGPYRTIIAPIVELGIFAMLTVLALGRWPSLRRSEDALIAALVAATLAACVPQIGPLLFYRPYTGNYTFGLAVNLLWLVPYRLELAQPRPPRGWLAPVMLVLGLIAGLCNEHTGLGFIAMGTLAASVALRRRRLRIWMIAGLLGLAVGYVLLLIAPGQHVRYQGLAGQSGVVERITARGALGNLRVVSVLALAMAAALPLLVVTVVERRTGRASRTDARPRIDAASRTDARPRIDAASRADAAPRTLGSTLQASVVLALGGLVCTLTLLASPKIGPRLYFASVALITAGLVGWLATELRSAWARRTCAILAAAALAYVEIRLVTTYRVVGPLGAARLDRIEHGAPGSVVTVPRYPVAASRYFLGDDFAAPRRASVATEYRLQAVELSDPGALPADPAVRPP